MKLHHWLHLLIACTSYNACANEISDSLNKIRFKNSGICKSSDVFERHNHPIQYLEPENVTKIMSTWYQMGQFPYLYRVKGDETTESSLRGGQVGFDTPDVPDHLEHPSSGIRSSVPLGGLASGTFELRGDGSIHEWTIENNSPAGAAKVPTKSEAVFGFEINGKRKLIRTHSPLKEVNGVDSIEYQGSYPFSKLSIEDAILKEEEIKLSLYGFSPFKLNSVNESSIPAINFVYSIENESEKDQKVRLFFNLPVGYDENMRRFPHETVKTEPEQDLDYLRDANVELFYGRDVTPPIEFDPLIENEHYEMSSLPDFASCAKTCKASKHCTTWSFSPDGTCIQSTDTSYPQNLPFYHKGSYAGVPHDWIRLDNGSFKCLVAQRKDHGKPFDGEIALCSHEERVSFKTSDSLAELLNDDALQENETIEGLHGAIFIDIVVPKKSSISTSFTLGYYFPHRNYLKVNNGNFYQHLVTGAVDAAKKVGESPKVLLNHINEQRAIIDAFLGTDTSFPDYLGDVLVNTLQHTRSAWKEKSGAWRQWEAYDCTNVQSVHNDGERHIPYLFFLPETTLFKMRAWAGTQKDNGMIAEQLASACFGIVPVSKGGGGRRMSDVTSMFIVYTLEMYQWTGDKNILNEFYDNVKAGAKWQIRESAEFGVPAKIVDTYDMLRMEVFNFTSYSALFHVLAMRAARKLAIHKGDTVFAQELLKAEDRAKRVIEEQLWFEEGGYYRAYVGSDAIFADTFYPQVLAYTLNLGSLLDSPKRVASHFEAVLHENGSKYGFRCLANVVRKDISPNVLSSIWMMGNQDFAVSAIWLGFKLKDALDVSATTLEHWRSVLNDQWNISGGLGSKGSGSEGLPYITSHYGYHMPSWHLVFALNGQYLNMIDSILKLAPNKELGDNGALPVMTLGTLSKLSWSKAGYRLTVVAGKPLKVNHLFVNLVKYPGKVNLKPGESISWATPGNTHADLE